jgi:hypothetical protein
MHFRFFWHTWRIDIGTAVAHLVEIREGRKLDSPAGFDLNFAFQLLIKKLTAYAF